MSNVIAMPAERGYHIAYRSGEINICPGCGRSHWYVGIVSAECAFCQTALPFEDAPRIGTPASIVRQNRHIMSAPRGRFVHNGRAA